MPSASSLPPDSDAFLAAIVASSNDAIISKDIDGTITSWNPGAERLFGFTAAEAIGRPITIIFPPDRLPEERSILQQILAGTRLEHFETVRRTKAGELVDISLTVSAIRDHAGRVIGLSKIARDIRAQKRAEAELRAGRESLAEHARQLQQLVEERTARLQEIVSELESFSYSLSHDLRAPLRAIQGFTEIVLTDYGAQMPDAAEHLRRVLRAAGRMDRLIQDVLALARVSRQDLSLGPIDLEQIISDLITERADLQPPRAIIEIAQPLLPVTGDNASVTQCIANLLDNAVKFVGPGAVPHVRVSTESRGDFVRLGIADNGIGIRHEDLEQVFTVFRRAGNAHTYEGSGVGLAIVRKAAERMGGRVGVTSSPGHGSTFWVELPAAPVAPVEAPVEAPVAAAQQV